VPVPNASLVTFTPELPSVTQSVADRFAAFSGNVPAPASVAAVTALFKKSRLLVRDMVALLSMDTDHLSISRRSHEFAVT
jgi:hypothetical protein